jgi:hypothetical protein
MGEDGSIFNSILNENSDLFLMCGDNCYYQLPGSRIFWKMMALLKPLNELPDTPTAERVWLNWVVSIEENPTPDPPSVVALHLNRRLWQFTALNSWTGGLSIGSNS